LKTVQPGIESAGFSINVPQNEPFCVFGGGPKTTTDGPYPFFNHCATDEMKSG
jgi:hypothetical protein